MTAPPRRHWLAVYAAQFPINQSMGALKMQDLKLTDQCARHEIAGHENAGHDIAGHDTKLVLCRIIILHHASFLS